MGREEQVEEREVLDSIFPDEITDISETEYRISIKLDLPEDDSDEASEPPTIVLYVRYPEAYPDEAPILDLSPPQHAAPPHPHFAVSADKVRLLKGLEDAIQENLGMAMVFTLVTTLKEEAEQLVADRRAAAAKAREELILAAEREENKKFHGTPVTPETFMRWREGFLKEMEEKQRREEEEKLAELKKAKVKEPVRLTGKQLWECGLAGKVDEGEGEDDDGIPTEQVEKIKIEA
ncbi:RWD-domain-containing protein [Daldinia caldariorum]|uniref:RWD-domain-containing protein n=1 Tax=Daldinia caldariorum TaxID=326644 RepID=UPI0020083F17|nr:RWD-domain-containing protein [Daldinia caldariorum]KAI1467329.1 RWD-domain-containing protein [Daldinia caldariorum]